MTATLDPVQLRETTDCPTCKAAHAFRPKGVFGQFWMKRCTSCGYYKDWPLPKITKKIIYLDQFVISNMVKAKQPFWTELHKKLSTLAALQLVVCPYSGIHEDESLLSHDLRDSLKEMYRSLGGEEGFRSPQLIEQDQLLRAIRSYLRIPESDSARPLWRDAFDRDPHSWTSDLQVFADFPVHEPWVTDLRNRKQALHADMENICENWKEEDHSFDEDLKREVFSYGRALLEMYRELAGGRKDIEARLPNELKGVYRACIGPDSFDPSTPPGVQPGVMLVHWLAREVHISRPDEADPVDMVEQFFQSTEAQKACFLDISSRLWATIAQRVRSKKGARNPKPSDSYDVKAIATFAPYCDAMFVDNEFRGMASQKNVDLPGRYGVQLFSMKSQDDFVSYLDNILHDISAAHLEGVSLIHPHLAPMLSLVGQKGVAP